MKTSVGYQARGFENPGGQRRRDIYVGLSLNLSRVLADGFYQGRMSTTPTQRTAEMAFELLQFPTAVYAGLKLDLSRRAPAKAGRLRGGAPVSSQAPMILSSDLLVREQVLIWRQHGATSP